MAKCPHLTRPFLFKGHFGILCMDSIFGGHFRRHLNSLVTQVVIREREKAWRIRFLSKFPLIFLSKFQGFQGRHLPLIGTAWLRHCPQVCIRACNFCMHGHHQCTILHMVLSLRCAVSCTLSPSRIIFAGIYGFRIGFSNLFLTEIILAFKFRPQILLFYFILFSFGFLFLMFFQF